MKPRLLRPEVHLRLADLHPVLTPTQADRLSTITDLLDEDGRFLLRAALDAGRFPKGDAKAQDAFQDFRGRVNEAAKNAGVDLRLQLDSRKTRPDWRYGWFEPEKVEPNDYNVVSLASPIADIVDALSKDTRKRINLLHAATERSIGEIRTELGQITRDQRQITRDQREIKAMLQRLLDTLPANRLDD